MGIFRINTGDERNHYVIHLALSNFLMVDYTLSKEAAYIKACSPKKHRFPN